MPEAWGTNRRERRSGDGELGPCPQRSAPVRHRVPQDLFAELLAWRRDVRHFRPGEAPDEAILNELFELAALAPSVGNCQPTRFVRVDDKPRRAAIRANFEAANRDALAAYAGRAGGALRQAQARGPQRRADPACGVLRRGDGAGARARSAHHAGGAPLFDDLRAAHVLAGRPRGALESVGSRYSIRG